METKIQAQFLADENLRKFTALKGLESLNDDFETFRQQNKFDLTALVPDLTSSDPEDAFCRVPYEKGHNLLFYVENLVGGPSAFAPYIKDYLKTFKDTPVNTKVWLDHLMSYFPEKKLLDSIPWKEIFLKPGPITLEQDLSNPLTAKCRAISDRWISSANDSDCQKLITELGKCSSLNANVKAEILNTICATNPKWSKEKFWSFADSLDVSKTKNCEIRTPWLRIGLSCELEEVIAPALELVETVGRGKYCRPLYRALYAWEVSRPKVLESFHRTKDFMNPITRRDVSIDLHLL